MATNQGPLDLSLLTELIASFESGNDLNPQNPFDVDHAFGPDWMALHGAFLSGCAVPDTEKWLPPGRNPDALAFATAGFLQGLAIGFEYAARQCPAQP